MFGRFGRDVGSLLGVDIACGAVRMLHMRRQRGQARVVGWACEPLPDGALRFDDNPSLVRALGEARRRCGSRQRRVALALPAAQVICKVAQLPRGISEQDLEGQLLAEAEHLFPFPLDDLALDFQLIGPAPQAVDKVEVLIAACRQSQLDPLEQLFAQAGLEVVAVEVDSFALRRVMAPRSPRAALLHIESDRLALHCWSQGPVAQCRQWSQADSSGWFDEVAALLAPGQGLVGVDALVLAGGAANAECAAQLSRRLSLPCHLMCLPEAGAAGPAPALHASMALACGLALGGLR